MLMRLLDKINKPETMYVALDYFFLIFHLGLVIFNLFGWLWKRVRKANLVVLLLTGSSWFILGLFYGIGYCPLTDWHWQVLEKLGHMPSESSYMQYLVARLFGVHFGSHLVDSVTVITYFVALILSVTLNILDWRKRES
jgi:hypothetical protein